jgi:small subunit ribosomal protein S1
LTEENQGGTAPEPEANAFAADQASEKPAGAIAVADEPATTDPIAPSTGSSAETSPAAGFDNGAATTAEAASSEENPSVAQAAPAVEAPATDEDERNGSGGVSMEDTADAPAAAEEEPEPPRELGPEPTTMAELLAEQDSDIKSFKHGDVVEGTVVRIDKDEMLVDIGAKSEGVVSNRELYGRNAESQPQLAVGDTVLVYVLQPESQEGHVVLSLRRAGLERKWRSMQEQFETGVIIEAPVIDHNKGGLIVDCGIRGFVPISQIVDFPRRPQNDQPRDAAQEIAEKLMPFVGRKLRLKILEVNRKANRLILSEKVALYEERREKRDELFSSLQVGQKVTGTVRSIAPFGVFIDLGGIDGLVHKSELSWNKVNNPEAGYKVGEEVEAEVIDINHERGRISLSIRRLQPDPWHSTVADFNVGDVIDGTVTKLVNFGAFVRVRDGLEGLIHISELSHQRVAHPGDVVHEGQQLKLKIISLDSERHRLGLSLKQAEEPPARPAPEPGQPAAPRTGGGGAERRPRQERSWAPSDAVQEPEGGIDNTLAAAFAQVRQQVAASEEAESEAPGDASEASSSASTDTAPTATAEPEAAASATAAPPATERDSAPPAEATVATAPEPAATEPAATEPPASGDAAEAAPAEPGATASSALAPEDAEALGAPDTGPASVAAAEEPVPAETPEPTATQATIESSTADMPFDPAAGSQPVEGAVDAAEPAAEASRPDEPDAVALEPAQGELPAEGADDAGPSDPAAGASDSAAGNEETDRPV